MLGLFRQCTLCRNNINELKKTHLRKRLYLSHRNSSKLAFTELAAAYKPHEVENSQIDNKYFEPPIHTDQKPFTLILPPPNITGTLHLGHALTVSIQDVLVKWNKMHGTPTMWVPGLDHAGIATQVVVEKKLWKEKGLTRHDLGREAFEKEVWKWKQEKSDTIIQQLKCLNVSLDWDREVFTMDENHSQAVTEAFIKLFDQGLIYRADHLVNWSCALQSAISDIEVDHLEIDGATSLPVPGYDRAIKFGNLTSFAYKIENSDEEIVVATTRPETILGDVAVAVHPKDPRYAHLVGKRLQHPFRNDLIPIIADDFVDPGFGTGAVKVTPAHDPVDFETSKKYNLKILSIINEKGYLNDNCGEFKGLKRFDARDSVLEQLAEKQLFRGSVDHKMTVPVCSRSKDVIEFLVKPQWFLRCKEMAEKAAADVREGKLSIEPKIFEKNWFMWLDGIRDWCISRQLWWGHRIPAFQCNRKNNKESKKFWIAAHCEENAKNKAARIFSCSTEEVEAVQDEDVLDTWFSSGLQPFSVFGWPQKTDDLQKYYPLSVMETGHDILFFWVARMIMLGTQLTGQLPFKNILLHGIICDAHGRKMSKSLGNVIAPEEVIKGCTLEELNDTLQNSLKSGILSQEELQKALDGQKKMFPNGIAECGADALRFTLLSHNVKSHVINFDINECHTNRLFGNKIWQATRFALNWTNKVSEVQENELFKKIESENLEELTPMDRWILSRLSYMISSMDDSMNLNDFHVATSSLKNFFYYEFCDIYVESVKTHLKEQTSKLVAKNHCKTLLTCLDQGLRALAPFMPALSQHLHKRLPRFWNIGLDKSFPKVFNLRDEHLESEVRDINNIITCIRRLKKIFNVTFKHNPEVYLIPSNPSFAIKFSQVIKDLSQLQALHILNKDSHTPTFSNLVEDNVGGNKVLLVVPQELIKSLALDNAKLDKKREKLVKELENMNKMISGSRYLEKVSLDMQENHRRKVAYITEKISRIDYIQNLTRHKSCL